jgi:hypothetical protein
MTEHFRERHEGLMELLAELAADPELTHRKLHDALREYFESARDERPEFRDGKGPRGKGPRGGRGAGGGRGGAAPGPAADVY